MSKFIEKLWKDYKILFFLLLPIVVLIVFSDLIFALIAGSARKVTKEAKRKDESLKSEQNKAEILADEKKKQADDIGKKADSVDVDEDWHKK